MERALIIVIIIMTLGAVYVVHTEVKKDNEFTDACHAKDGVVIRTEDRTHCVRRDAFIRPGQ
jgi:hypothetical protein